MSVSFFSDMWCKLIAVSLMFCAVVQTTDVQQQNAKKKVVDPTQTPTTLSDVVNLLKNLEKRIIDLESKRTLLLRGRDGRDGKDGRDGRDGSPGLIGPPGLKGEQGQQGVKGPPGPKSGGVQYVRWGRTTCHYNATLVYKGRIGGEEYTHTGGGANYVCLPETPKYGRYEASDADGAYMYGTEYQVSSNSPFNTKNLHDHDAPCAVCYVTTRSVKMMIPATYECPAGWTREYHGYLMAQHYGYVKSDFICVDQDTETVPGSHGNFNGALLYHVEGRCGSLPCHPYVEGRELTCVVCTK